MSVNRRAGVALALAGGLAAAGCSHEVKIGAVISETGAVASYGEKVRKGLELALDEINGAGGLARGGKVVLLFRDDATNPDRGREVAQELIEEEGLELIVGAVSSRVTLAIAPLCEQERVLLLSPTSSSPEITEAGDYIYRNYPSDIREGTSMARFAKDLGLARVVIISMGDEFGAGLRDVFTRQYESRARQVVGAFEFREDDARRFGEIAAETEKLAPQGVYVVAYENALAAMLPLLADSDLRPVIMTTSAVTASTVKLAGASAENLVFPQSWFDVDSPHPAVATFVRAYRERYGEEPDLYAAHGYDALKLLARAIQAKASTHADDVRRGLNEIEDYQGAAGKTTFDKNGDVLRHPRIMIIRNGSSVPYDEFVAQGGSVPLRG